MSDVLLQARDVPLLGIGVLGDGAGDDVVDHAVAHVVDGVAHALFRHELLALLEHDLALVVHDVVVFQDVLADVEVARLDLRLRPLDGLVDPRMDDGLAFLQAELLQHAVHAVGAEDAHQVVLERQVELGAARIALAAGAAAQLVVDAAGFVALGAEHVEAAGGERLLLEGGDLVEDRLLPGGALLALEAGELALDAHLGVAAELDVGAAAGHVGGDGDRARHAGLGDDEGFLLVEAGVQHGEVLGAAPGAGILVEGLERQRVLEVDEGVAVLDQQLGEILGLLDGGGADQDRLALGGGGLDVADDRLVALVRRPVDLVVVVDAGNGTVGRDLDHVEVVDLQELVGFRRGRAGHAARACRRGGSSSGR